MRIDTHVYANYNIPPFYDSLIAKVLAHGKDRAEAIARMGRILSELIFEGVKTTIPFNEKVLKNENFKKGIFNTTFLEEEFTNANTE